jgi:hypothetical protein
MNSTFLSSNPGSPPLSIFSYAWSVGVDAPVLDPD